MKPKPKPGPFVIFIQFNTVYYHFNIVMLQLLYRYLHTHVFYNLYSTFTTLCEHLGSHNTFL